MGNEGGLSRHGCELWKSIKKVKDIFWKFICFQLGSAREIRFWEDRWNGDSPLRDMFRNLYSLATDPMGRVFKAFDESNIWKPWLCHNLNDWEIDDFGRVVGDALRYKA